jgi:hypothetical protein
MGIRAKLHDIIAKAGYLGRFGTNFLRNELTYHRDLFPLHR